MRLKKRKENRKYFAAARVTEAEYNKIKLRAGLYCEGNISDWVVSAALNYEPRKEHMKKDGK